MSANIRRRGRHDEEGSQLRKPLLAEEEDADLGDDRWYGSKRRVRITRFPQFSSSLVLMEKLWRQTFTTRVNNRAGECESYEPVSTRSDDAQDEDDSHRTSREGAAASRWWEDNFATILMKWITWIEMLPSALGSLLNYIGRKLVGWFQPSVAIDRTTPPVLSPTQVERFAQLQKRSSVPFSSANPQHQEALRKLWRLAYPHQQLTGMVSEQWKDMGWQGTDPSTDFRGGGFISLENLLYFAENHPRDFQRLLNKEDGVRAQWEYPFAVAGLNLSFMLVELLDLKAEDGVPSSAAGRAFLRFLEEDESAFDALYVRAFLLLDAEWLSMKASYMDFNVVMKAVRAKLEQSLRSPRVKTVDQI